jgi:hypothetical protein
MINRAGYTWRGLPPSETENLTEAKAVALAVKHPVADPPSADRTRMAVSPLALPTR